MSTHKYTQKISESFERLDEKCDYELAFRRWLVREIEEERMTNSEAIKQFNLPPDYGYELLRNWRKKYAPEMVLSLPEMTELEKQKLDALQKQLNILEQALEDSKMKNIALNMLIDVAEEKLKINIRKKSGTKQ